MKIFVSLSGGVANIGPIQGKVDTAELPPDLAQEVDRWIKPAELKKVGKKNPFMADGQYISVGFRTSEKAKYREYEVDESSADPELFEVCNALVNQVIIKRANIS